MKLDHMQLEFLKNLIMEAYAVQRNVDSFLAKVRELENTIYWLEVEESRSK